MKTFQEFIESRDACRVCGQTPCNCTTIDEAHKLGDAVMIHNGPKDAIGSVGHIGEIRHGAHKTAPKTYTIDYGDRKSIQLPSTHFKAHKSTP